MPLLTNAYRLLGRALPRARPFSEMGVAGTPVVGGYVITGERSAKVIGQEKYRTYADILTNTSIIAAGMRYFLNIIAKPSWSCEPADQSDKAKKAAEFVEETIYEGTKTPWSRIVRRAGTYRFYGFAIQEWTAVKNDDGTVGFEDIESRPQWTIWRWEIDERGTIMGAWQRDPISGKQLGLPRKKIMYLVDDTLTDNPEGMGLLRHCVEPVDRLKEYIKQEGYGFARDLRGIPIGRAPIEELEAAVRAGAITNEQKQKALDTLMDFVSLQRKDADTGLLLNSQPYKNLGDSGESMAGQFKWDAQLLSGTAPGLADVNTAITRIQTEIARILGMEHLMIGAGDAGSFALAKEKSQQLYLLANSVLSDIRLQAQNDLIEPLWVLNGFDDALKPKLKSEDVAPKDVAQVSAVLQQMAAAGAPIPPGDEETVNFVRDLLGAPHVDMADVETMYPQDLLHAQGGYEPSLEEQYATEAKYSQPTAKRRGNGFDTTPDRLPPLDGEVFKRALDLDRVVINLDE